MSQLFLVDIMKNIFKIFPYNFAVPIPCAVTIIHIYFEKQLT